jgi:NADH:ubiquinone oxidoreductase subunit 6 (subunit J)
MKKFIVVASVVLIIILLIMGFNEDPSVVAMENAGTKKVPFWAFGSVPLSMLFLIWVSIRDEKKREEEIKRKKKAETKRYMLRFVNLMKKLRQQDNIRVFQTNKYFSGV